MHSWGVGAGARGRGAPGALPQESTKNAQETRGTVVRNRAPFTGDGGGLRGQLKAAGYVGVGKGV